jgi:hypothetical protein
MTFVFAAAAAVVLTEIGLMEREAAERADLPRRC